MHSLAEFYATITALPTRNRFDPQQTVQIRKRCTLIPLTAEDYALTQENVASRGLTSGKVYDALLLRLCGHGKRGRDLHLEPETLPIH